MKIVKLILITMFSLGESFSFTPYLASNKHSRNLPSIKMTQSPDYNPIEVINSLARSSDNLQKWSINEFINEAAHKHIDSASLLKNPITENIKAMVAIDNNYKGAYPSLENLHYIESGIQKMNDILVDTLIKNDIFYTITQLPNQGNQGNQMAGGFNPISFIVNSVILYFVISIIFTFIQQLRGGGGPGGMNPMSVSKLQSGGVVDSKDINTNFEDVAGCDEAKYELEEIVEFLKNPQKFNDAGAKVPKGVLLEGPPGTGKTLLARAVAGEAQVSFIQASASEFIQMFVGVGASRVRDLFDTAKNNAPCVVFIDELDAVGRKRGEQFGGGGNEEREQTLNQILTNMDGFEKTDSLIVLAATNRVDILDSALTRSGRFDRKVRVGLPDLVGRRKIIDVHLRGKTVKNNTDLDEIAAITSGFSGADIENMANEAVILALRTNNTEINSKNLIDAYEKITIGLPLLLKEPNKDEQELVSYHEAGHTITALLFREFFDVRKVTITANTNGAGGYTLFTPKEKYNSYPTKKYLISNLIVTMGGRAAEKVLYNKIITNLNENYNYNTKKVFDDIKDLDVTTGASSDLMQADNLARRYIQLFGIEDDELTKTIQNQENPYTLSEETKSDIDANVNKLINFALNKAVSIIERNMEVFNKLAKDLAEKKSVDLKYLDKLHVEYF